MQAYQWAVKTTLELLDGDGGVEGEEVTVLTCASEKAARATHEATAGHLALPARRHPKYQRLAKSELLRRPIGEWETMDEAVQV